MFNFWLNTLLKSFDIISLIGTIDSFIYKHNCYNSCSYKKKQNYNKCRLITIIIIDFILRQKT